MLLLWETLWSPPLRDVIQEDDVLASPEWRAFQIEDGDSTFPPTPPVVTPNIGLDDQETMVQVLDRIWLIGDDEAAGYPPTPPRALQDDDPQKWTGILSVFDDGQESSLTPTPPFVIQPDDDSQKTNNWQAFHHDDALTEFSNPPTPPPALQDDDPEKWTSTWAIVDDGQERSLPPTPPPAFQADEDTQRWVDKIAVVDDGQESLFPPLPPFVPSMGFDDESAQFSGQVNWSAVIGVEEMQYGIIVVPPPPSVGLESNVYLGHGNDMGVSGNIQVGGIG